MPAANTGDLAGKVAIVTGASSGIGYAIAQLFARHGAAVAINYVAHADAAHQLVGEIEAAGGRAHGRAWVQRRRPKRALRRG